MRDEAIQTVAQYTPAAAGAAGMVVLGVPQGMLIAAFLGAALSFYFQRGERETRIPWIVFGVIAIAFAGAWVAVAIPHLDVMNIGDTAGKVDARARAGLSALAFQSLWNFWHRWGDRKVEGS
ncbi:hypothetical protein [Lysobacter olei]